jgi:hypothetical protein
MYWLYAGMQDELLQRTFIMYLLYGYFVDSAENLRRDSWEKNNSIKGDGVGGGGALKETVNLVLFLDPVFNTNF